MTNAIIESLAQQITWDEQRLRCYESFMLEYGEAPDVDFAQFKVRDRAGNTKTKTARRQHTVDGLPLERWDLTAGSGHRTGLSWEQVLQDVVFSYNMLVQQVRTARFTSQQVFGKVQ